METLCRINRDSSDLHNGIGGLFLPQGVKQALKIAIFQVEN